MNRTLSNPAQAASLPQTVCKAGFTLFAVTWALADFFHQLSFIDWRWQTARGGLLTAAIISYLFKPPSWKRFAMLILTDWVVVALAFPVVPNHIFFAWIVNATLLAALVITLRRREVEDVAVPVPDFCAMGPCRTLHPLRLCRLSQTQRELLEPGMGVAAPQCIARSWPGRGSCLQGRGRIIAQFTARS